MNPNFKHSIFTVIIAVITVIIITHFMSSDDHSLEFKKERKKYRGTLFLQF